MIDHNRVRNFSIISHIDHGKSTLADRLLEITKTIPKEKMKPQFLDTMDLEREKGITIKLQSCRMEYEFEGLKYILNLVDTPGHVDFSYEVSRSLAAVEGALILVDAAKGIQAQTLANLELAKKQNLVIIPIVNKIDLPQASVEETAEDLANLLGIDKNEVLKISAKNGTNVDKVLEAVIKKIPAPKVETGEKPFRALIFGSNYDHYKGIIAFVRVVDGEIQTGSKIRLFASEAKGEIKELGYFKPGLTPQNKISAGEIGYIATGVKEPGKVLVGDTIIEEQDKFSLKPLPGYQRPEPMVFASLYPENPDDFDLLRDALSKLKLNDPSFIFEPETKESLGRGFRCGFLGTLHAEIISERLSREFGLRMVISSPSVIYKIIDQKDRENFIYSATDWPDAAEIKKIEEPYVSLKIITPIEYIGKVSEILKSLDGKYIETQYLSGNRAILIYETPLREVIVNLFEKMKSATQGYASMNYEVSGFKPGNLVKMEILIAGKKEEAFSKIVPEEKAFQEGKNLVKKLKEVLPSQQFSVALQAAIGGKIIARETIKSRRKDVTGYLYGGDVTRKKKLLEKQRKGKQELKEKGSVRIPQKVFLEVFRG